ARFLSQVGVSDSYGDRGSVVFQVFADGVKIYDSGLVTGTDAARSLDVDVTGVAQLRLVTTPGPDGNSYDLGVWGDARLNYSPELGGPRAPSNAVATPVSPTEVAVTW